MNLMCLGEEVRMSTYYLSKPRDVKGNEDFRKERNDIQAHRNASFIGYHICCLVGQVGSQVCLGQVQVQALLGIPTPGRWTRHALPGRRPTPTIFSRMRLSTRIRQANFGQEA